MKKVIYILIAFAIFSCNSNSSLETRVKNFMKDSVVTGFDDPKSYEWVSMDKPDSVFIHSIAEDRIKKYEKDNERLNLDIRLNKIELESEIAKSTGTATDKEIINGLLSIDSLNRHTIGINKNNIDLYKGYLSRPDSLISINIAINCRAKNKLGALIMNTINLKLDPSNNKLEVID